jgi:hypothetical protein
MEPAAGTFQHGAAKAGEVQMRLNAMVARMTELLLIAAMGGIGAYAFLASGAYEAVNNYGTAHHLGFMSYLPLLIWLFIAGFGLLNIVIFNRGSGSFTWLVVIFSLPSLLAHNSVDWAGMAGLKLNLSTSLGFNAMLALGVLTMTGYVILNYLRFFKESEHSMIERQADQNDIENINGFSNSALLIAVSGALAATALVAFLARGLEKLALDAVKKMPWNTVLIGLFCFLLLAFYLYWLGARRKGKEITNNQDTNTKQ